jgi:NAD-dependent DNA ligase
MTLFEIEHRVLLGDIECVRENLPCLNDAVGRILKADKMTENDIRQLRSLINIFNIIYNNSPNEDVLIDDGIYDMLVTKLMNLTGETVPGAPVVDFKDNTEKQSDKKEPFCPVRFFDKDEREEHTQYYGYLLNNDTAAVDRYDRFYGTYYPNSKNIRYSPVRFNTDIAKRTHTAEHGDSTLVGTLDKCKFVFVNDAVEAGVDLNDPKIKILERDFFAEHIKNGIIDPNEDIEVIISLKYDGCSIEADCSNMVLGARSRGDTGIGLASDMTPILKGYGFPRGIDTYPDYFNIKFEAIMTYENLARYNAARGYNYANCRSAINGLFGASDAWKYRDLITLVPLDMSYNSAVRDVIEDDYYGRERVGEIAFLNSFYVNHNIPYICTVENGNYRTVLWLIRKFLQEAEYARDFMGFMYDGIVVEYASTAIRKKLGRKGYINQFAMAVKFNPLKKQTIFRYYTFSVGKDRSITPKAHYDPVEFMGTIQPNSSVHSYANFMELGLKPGDIIDVTYVNDVMAQVSKKDIEANAHNPNEPFPFPTVCPICGAPITISESGKSAYCTNARCDGAKISRMVDTLAKLGFEGFAEESVKTIGIYSISELLESKPEQWNLGEADTDSLLHQLHDFMCKDVYDFEYMGALGFTNTGTEKWKKILSVYSMDDIMAYYSYEPIDEFMSIMRHIPGIGPKTIEIIANEFGYFYNDVRFGIDCLNLVQSKGMSKQKTIRYTGFRNPQLAEQLNSMGYDAKDGSVTKSTDILLVPYTGFQSSKVAKAGPTTRIIAVDDFMANMDEYLAEQT